MNLLREWRKEHRRQQAKTKRMAVREHLLQMARREGNAENAITIALVANSRVMLRMFVAEAEDRGDRTRPLLDLLAKLFNKIADDPEAFMAMILNIIKMIFGLLGTLNATDVVAALLKIEGQKEEVRHLQIMLAA